MNCVSFVACFWLLLGGTLLTYGFPENSNPTNELPPTELKPQKTANPSSGKSEVYTDTHDKGAELQSNAKPDVDQAVAASEKGKSNSSSTTESISTTTTLAPTTPAITTSSTTKPTTEHTTTTQPTTAKPSSTTIPTEPTTPTTPNTTPSSTTHLAPTSIIPNSTQSPEPTKPTSAPETDRRFDGPSFIGGIVFALGITAIGFVAWKFYKARTERNYHTL